MIYLTSGFKFSQLEMSSFLIKSKSRLAELIYCFFLEVILVLLLEKMEFSLSDKKIFWQMAVIATPNVDMVSTTPTLPMKLSLVD